MSKFGGLVLFVAGAALGGATAWYFRGQLAEEDIASVKEVYAKREQKPTADNDMSIDKAREKASVMEYAKKLQEEGYVDYSKSVDQKKQDDVLENVPYVISPEEFGETEEYTKISLTFYEDGVLADELNEVVDDVEEIVGDALSHFGEYEDDSVFVRNDAKRCDYEILRDLREFAEVRKTLPPSHDEYEED